MYVGVGKMRFYEAYYLQSLLLGFLLLRFHENFSPAKRGEAMDGLRQPWFQIFCKLNFFASRSQLQSLDSAFSCSFIVFAGSLSNR